MSFQNRILISMLGLLALVLLVLNAGCQPDSPDLEEEVVLEGTGVLTGQIDSQSIAIDLEGELITFILQEGVSVTGIEDGSKVSFSYIEEEPAPLILSIVSLEEEELIYEEMGTYLGQIDNHSVEISVDGQARAFEIGEKVSVDQLVSGSRVLFTYRDDDQRLILMTLKVIEEPVGDDNDELTGEGVLEGQIDAHSVEISIKRIFVLSDVVSAEEIEIGSLVAFGFTENGRKATIYSLEAVNEPLEGRIMHGILTGRPDDRTVEIEYHQAFGLDEGVSIEGIGDGAEVVYTYYQAEHRPVLTSIAEK
jgi:hypothetical protein